jgi:hypothetical protein
METTGLLPADRPPVDTARDAKNHDATGGGSSSQATVSLSQSGSTIASPRDLKMCRPCDVECTGNKSPYCKGHKRALDNLCKQAPEPAPEPEEEGCYVCDGIDHEAQFCPELESRCPSEDELYCDPEENTFAQRRRVLIEHRLMLDLTKFHYMLDPRIVLEHADALPNPGASQRSQPFRRWIRRSQS